MRQIIKQLLTGSDNQTQDLGRWSWLISNLLIIAATAYNASKTGAVSVSELAQAIGIVATAHGVALWVKRDTEPK